MEDIINKDMINEVLYNGREFETAEEIEDALLFMQEIDSTISHVKALKERRTAAYNDEISSQNEKKEKLRESILNYMKSHNKKSSKYPGIGSVSLRNQKGKWIIEDEDALVKHCQDLGVGEDAITTQIKINKTKINKVLNELQENNNLPEGVEKTEDSVSLSVTIEDGASKPQRSQVSQSVQEKEQDSMEDLDSLDI